MSNVYFLFYNDSSFTTKILTKHNVNKVAIKKSNCIFQSGYVDCSDTFLKSDDAEVKLGSPSYRINELQFRFDPHDDNTSIGLDNIIEIKMIIYYLYLREDFPVQILK